MQYNKTTVLHFNKSINFFQVETAISVYSNVIDVNDYTTSFNMKSKTIFLTSADQLLVDMCAGLAFGEAPAIAKSKLAVLQSYKPGNFSGVNINYIQLGCSNCTSYTSAPSQVLLGGAIKANYSDWSCRSTDKCSGVCVTSAQVSCMHILCVNMGICR